jgi:hypothetical protein
VYLESSIKDLYELIGKYNRIIDDYGIILDSQDTRLRELESILMKKEN